MKRTALVRRTPLKTTRRLRGAGLFARQVRFAEIPRASSTRRRRPTGFDRPTRRAIYDRDGHACVCCGITKDQAPLTVHHRINRGHGGNPTVNTVVHGIVCCWPCNGLMETSPERAAEARRNGWKLLRHQDPAQVPVLYPDEQRWLLRADGTRHPA